MEVVPEARKHGVSDEDMLHAVRNAIRQISDGDRVLLIGPDLSSRLLEVVVIDPDSDDPAIIHAMALRPTFFRYL